MDNQVYLTTAIEITPLETLECRTYFLAVVSDIYYKIFNLLIDVIENIKKSYKV